MTMSPAAAEPRFSSLVPSLMAQYTTAAAAAAEEQQHRSSIGAAAAAEAQPESASSRSQLTMSISCLSHFILPNLPPAHVCPGHIIQHSYQPSNQTTH